MAFSLAPTASLDGYRLEAYETVGSTNALALERVKEGDSGRLWIVSRRQESGRGRRGRAWETPHGNLAATLLWVGQGELKLAATLGFVAGLALSDALTAVVPQGRIGIGVDGGGQGGSRFELKWPNDVLAGGAKLAGILLESLLLADNHYALAIGIGVNVVAHPEGLPYPATSLAALGSTADAETLFLALSDAWTANARDWDEGRGLARIRNRWLARAAGLGSDVAVRVDGNVVRGVFETIDDDCRFVIRSLSGEEVRIAAGDVHFGAVASAGAA
ncbi:MAG TPA: biotin--[acetyl-CoA-carboxylase] ligase [Hyphomicrobiaceae bacterium]|nr:biotin--[acetyl-CoA-carboxylase] ligase [Hyphomicrobiaceae bacterium]